METKNNVSIAVPEVLDSVTDGREESADELESIVQHLNEISMTFPLLVRKKPEARDCANIITAISSCLGNLVTFPDIPVGQKACKFLSNQWIAVRSLAEISVYLAIASLFLAIGQEVLDVPEEEFQKLVDNMEFVKEHFGAIRRNFKDVDDLWRKVLSESEMDGTTLENVKKLVDNAYMAVTHCQHKLKEFAKEDKGKITERFTGQ